jgi:flagellar hook-associated protein 2
MTRLDDYMTEQLSSTSGFLVTKKETIDDAISRLDDSIALMETRLEKRQETLEAQFTAMETLISSLNSMQEYLEGFFEDYNSD